MNQGLFMIDLFHTLDSGQSFTWKKQGNFFVGIANGKLVRCRQEGEGMVGEGAPKSFFDAYFRLNDDFEGIKKKLAEDQFLSKPISSFPGLRILRQDPWECAVSFVCSPLNNVKRITLMLSNLCRQYGEEKQAFGVTEHLFPSPDQVVDAGEASLRKMGFGFRARFAVELAKAVHENGLDLASLRKKDYETARQELLQVHGIGEKVADCILLFSCDKLEAFPVDVWIDRVLRKNYGIRKKGPAASRLYGMKKFGENAGYAQQFLYHGSRSRII